MSKEVCHAQGAGVRVVARNRRATHDYTIGDTWEAGLVLQGTEVKSLRAGKATLTDAFAQVDERGEVWMYNLHIPEYAFGTWRNHDVMRKRKLLLNKREIAKLSREADGPGKTIVPLQLYFKDGYAKVEIAVGTGKRTGISARRSANAMPSVKLSELWQIGCATANAESLMAAVARIGAGWPFSITL